MEKKQSSIEWLENEIDFILLTYSYNSQDFHLNKAFEKAKAMHKEEVVNAYQAGDGDAYNLDETRDFGEQYYTETFGGQDNE